MPTYNVGGSNLVGGVMTAIKYGDRIKLVPDGDALRIEAADDPLPPVDPVAYPTAKTIGHGVPNFGYQPTAVTVRPGSLTDPATWGGTVPGADDRVVIAHDVTFDGDMTLHAIAVAAKLDFRGGTLRVKDGLIYETGTLDTSKARKGSTWLYRDLPIDLPNDPASWGTGLVILGKHIRKGLAVKIGYAESPKTIAKGATRIELDAIPEGWEVGDTVYLPNTSQLVQSRNERNKIAEIDGNAIVLETPTLHEHQAAYDAKGNLVKGPIVKNLTRDMSFRSENPDGTRGHYVVTSHGTEDIVNCYFEGGRTIDESFIPVGEPTYAPDGTVLTTPENQVARYAYHRHHVHGVPCKTFGCVVDNGDVDRRQRFGASLHVSHGGEFSDNIAVGIAHRGLIVTEDGPEVEINIKRNVASGSPVGFWPFGVRNWIDDNIACGCDIGFEVGYNEKDSRQPLWVKYPADISDPHGEMITRRHRNLAPLSFKGNCAFGCRVPFRVWNVGAIWNKEGDTPGGSGWGLTTDAVPNPDADEFVIEDFLALHSEDTTFIYFEPSSTLARPRFYGDVSRLGSRNTAITVGAASTPKVKIVEPTIENYHVGIRERGRGHHEELTVIGGEFACPGGGVLVSDNWSQRPVTVNLIDVPDVAVRRETQATTQPLTVLLTRGDETWQLYRREAAPENAVELPGVDGLAVKLSTEGGE